MGEGGGVFMLPEEELAQTQATAFPNFGVSRLVVSRYGL